jgi:hypothetical protein
MCIEVVAREKSGRMIRSLRTGMQHVVREFLCGCIYQRDAMLGQAHQEGGSVDTSQAA